jgi:hypothetical protein
LGNSELERSIGISSSGIISTVWFLVGSYRSMGNSFEGVYFVVCDGEDSVPGLGYAASVPIAKWVSELVVCAFGECKLQ